MLKRSRPCLSGILIFLLVAAGVPLLSAQDQTPTKLNIEIIEGEDAVNNIRLRTAREPIVEVTDENHKPIAGAVVIFSTPENGAGGAFAGGAKTLTVTTDAQGRAVAQGLQPNATRGKYQIQVQASYLGVTATRAIKQANGGAGLSLAAKILIGVAVAAGAAAGGAIAATSGGGGGGSGSKPTVLSPGPPSVGGPR
jgi:hypothetical protein